MRPTFSAYTVLKDCQRFHCQLSGEAPRTDGCQLDLSTLLAAYDVKKMCTQAYLDSEKI